MTKQIAISEELYEYLEAKKKDFGNLTFNQVIARCVSRSGTHEAFIEAAGIQEALVRAFVEQPLHDEMLRAIAHLKHNYVVGAK